MIGAGFDLREWTWKSLAFIIGPGATTAQASNAPPNNQGWRVTRIQFFNAGVDGSLMGHLVRANGCLELKPDGLHTGSVFASGDGGLLVIEYIWKATATGVEPAITVT